MNAPSAPVTVFYSYAHEDEPLRDDLQDHLKILERRGLIAPWHDRRIAAGDDWDERIDEHLRQAELVLLLVSKDFIGSDYIFGNELKVAMQRHESEQATVVPIMVRAVDMDPEDAEALPFLRLQGLPTDLRPVTSWPNVDEAWTNVARGLRATVKAIIERRAERLVRTGGVAVDIVAALAAATAAARVRPDVPVLPPLSPAPPMPPASTDLPAPPPALDLHDPVLDRVVGRFSASIAEAAAARGGEAPDPGLLRDQALALIDRKDAPRVLWVDDRPQGNAREIAALEKLQVDVVTAVSTADAQARLAASPDGFDLVISDWDRRGEPPDAGLALLDWLRARHPDLPFVCYHGEFDPRRRAARALQAQAHGALGEAVLPDELLALVLKALRG